MTPPAGWYPDPSGAPGQRYWDGGRWLTVAGPAHQPEEGRVTIHYGFALLAVLAILGTVVPCIFLFVAGVSEDDPDAGGMGIGMAVMWGLWGGVWILIWSAFAIHHTLKSRS
ncbi:hypothetical protein A5761_15215 [Mycolicibacterium setense]|uniref:DUF2510 domain-containing protein n=1 Tax=Mycolicibacterium setense TaxID=431269 RepID=UPI0007EA99C5|nr:DUF2510 domain-containing protein [Mycolicibacterium setense]OBB15085.1 hypothetical protein A5761_15215 [Mycolicibacterium setense]